MDLARPYARPDRDTAPFWEAQRNYELRLQRCSGCGMFRFPVTPLCPECRSFDFDWAPCSGRGTIYSYTVVHHQTHPAFPVPYTIVLVELEEGPRLIGQLQGAPGASISIDAPARVQWEDVPNQSLPVWLIEGDSPPTPQVSE
jgi:3-oxo-4,17-pregnadiene-20-carboxyl-CoA hydratase alpha subunit